MMFATSLDFATGRIMVGAPTALWWTQLATAVVFGLGIATVLTLVVTPAALAARIWLGRGIASLAGALSGGGAARRADRRLAREFRRQPPADILWEDPAGRPAPASSAPPSDMEEHHRRSARPNTHRHSRTSATRPPTTRRGCSASSTDRLPRRAVGWVQPTTRRRADPLSRQAAMGRAGNAAPASAERTARQRTRRRRRTRPTGPAGCAAGRRPRIPAGSPRRS